MTKKAKINVQDAFELQTFARKLQTKAVTTPEFKSALMVMRQHCGNNALLEWANSVAHSVRNRGLAFEAGARLWTEKFHIDEFFNTNFYKITSIPIPIFKKLLATVNNPQFNFAGIDLEAQYPGGFSREELLASLNWMYQEKGSVYRLISRRHQNHDDLRLVQQILFQFRSLDWAETPYHFNKICDDIAITLHRLIGTSTKEIQKCKDTLAMHFLCAFHMTEIDLRGHAKRLRTRCFLSVDSTSSGNLCLSLGLYKRAKGYWDAYELSKPNWISRQAGCHNYVRPLLLTDLEEKRHFWNGTGSEVSSQGGLRVKKRRDGGCVLQPFCFS